MTVVARFRVVSRRFCNNRSGNFALLSAILATPLVLAASLSVDMGNAYRVAEGTQRALDSAALAAVRKYSIGGSEQDAQEIAADFFKSNFAKNTNQNLSDQEFSQGFSLKLDASSSNYTATASFSFSYVPVFLPHVPFPIDRTSVARRTSANQACVLALSPSIKRAFNNAGGADTDMTGCIVMSDSANSELAYVDSNSSMKADCMFATGGVNADTAATDLTCGKPRAHIASLRDPFADRTMPTPDKAGLTVPPPDPSTGVTTLVPGTYKNGLSIKGATELQAGNYIIDGGSLTLNANADLTALGVTFFLTNGASLKINGGADFNITPSETGEWAGFAIVADHANANAATINGNSNSNLTGIVYLPDATTLSYSGDGSTASGQCIRLVAQTITLTGHSKFRSDCTAQLAGTTITTVMDPYLVR